MYALFFAAAQAIATYNVPLETEHDYGVVVAVQLNDDATLRLEKRMYATYDEYEVLETREQRLSQRTFETLRADVIKLSAAEVKTTHNPAVCMVLPPIGEDRALSVRRDYNADNEAFAGDLNIVLTKYGCWRGEHSAPTSDRLDAVAEGLIRGMTLLTYEAVTP